MRTRPFATVLAALLTLPLIAPPVFLIAPQSVSAQAGAAIAVPTGEIPFSLMTLKEIATAANTFLTEVNTYASYINSYVLQPAALIKSGNLMKSMTAGVIAFVTGTANGTGAAQFVQNLQGNLQRVGDTQATAFFAQFGRNSNSPFASSIISSLRTNYLQNTSAAGFWGANRSTLALASPNINAYLAGNWSQGGTKAWFALTTQTQNNPYTLYQASQSQLASIVGGAQAARTQALNWGQGFMSWCGAVPEGLDTESGDAAPLDPCIQSDGTPGTIRTPGSVIKASLDKVLGGQQDKLVQIGAVAKEIGGIMGNLASIWQTVQFAQQVLGGSNSGGLYGLGQSIGSNPNNQPNNPPVDTGTGPTSPVTVAAMSQRLEQYQSAWDTIRAATNTASTSVASLANFCSDAATIAATDPSLTVFVTTARNQADTARNALATAVAPVFAQATDASTIITTVRALLSRIQSTNPPSAADIQALQTLRPTATDVSTAEQNAAAAGAARATPQGSLSVSGSSLVDQMSLISTNATALRAVCTSGSGGSGGTTVDAGTLVDANGQSGFTKYKAATVNVPLCWSFDVNSAQIGKDFGLYWTTNTDAYTGGNIQSWIATSLGGAAISGTLQTKPFTYTGVTHFMPTETRRYYSCVKLDTAGNTVGAWLLISG